MHSTPHRMQDSGTRLRLPRRLWFFSLLSFLTLLNPRRAEAQSEPIVTITPVSHTVVSGTTVQVGIYWCTPDGEGFSSQTVKLGSTEPGSAFVDISDQFADDSWSHQPPPECDGPNAFWQHWTGTVELQPGGNVVRAQGYSWSSWLGSDEETYTIVPPFRAVSVIAQGQYLEAPPSLPGPPPSPSQKVLVFTVTNTGDAEETFDLEGVCELPNTAQWACGSIVPAQVVLGPGQSDNASLTMTMGEVQGAEGVATVKATHVTQRSIMSSTTSGVTVTPAMADTVAIAGGGDVVERGLCLTMALRSDVAYECGDLRIVHALPTVRTFNVARTPVLHYNSLHAEPHPVVSADVKLAVQVLPTTVHATLRVNGVRVKQASWSGSDWGAVGNTRRISIGLDSAFSTGLYHIELEIGHVTFGISYPLKTVSARLPIVNRQDSPFGAGWWLAGLEQLHFLPGDSIFWFGGDGSTRLYRPQGSNVWLATSVDGPDSLTRDGTEYHRRLPNALRVRFDAAGKHIATINRLGRVTRFAYTVVNGRTVLDSIVLPSVAGIVAYTFGYNTLGQLTTVTSPGASGVRTTTLTVNSSNGRVDQITDPDTESVVFGYGATAVRRITSRRDRRNFTTHFAYDGGRLRNDSLQLSTGVIVRKLLPMEVAGLAGTVRPSAQPLDSVYTQVDGPRADVSDVSRFWFTRFGALARVRDPLGRETKVSYGNASFPGLATDLRDASRFRTLAYYNARGLVDSTVAVNPVGTGANARTSFLWDPSWNVVVRSISPAGVHDTLEYDPATGNRLWQQTGPSPTTRVWFDYFPATHHAAGLLASIMAPGLGTEHFAYDNVLGNLNAQQDPSGAVTIVHADALGRDTLVLTPIDGSRTGWVRTIYDVMDQVTRTVSFGPGDALAAADSVVVTQAYDAEGNLEQVGRTRGVHAGANVLMSTYTWDGAGRKTAEASPNRVDTYVRDSAGNITSHVTGLGTIRMQYDAADQLVRRIVPGVTYGSTWCGSYIVMTCLYTLPTYGSSVCIAPDTARFGYDAAGRVARADNNYARIRRSYTPGGLIATDSSWIRSYYSSGSVPCEQVPANQTAFDFAPRTGLSYTYDVGGRRTALTHPEGTQHYDWNDPSGRGLLAGVTDVGNRTYGFRYDALGRIDTVTYPGGVKEARDYGLDGHVHLRRVTAYTNGQPSLIIYDSLTRDLRGRITDAYTGARAGQASGLTAVTRYSGLGAVVWADDYGLSGGDTEGLRIDALGNRLRWHRAGTKPAGHIDYWGVRHATYLDEQLMGVSDTLGSAYYVHQESFEYDAQGNQATRFVRQQDQTGTPTSEFHDLAKSYYSVDGKLRVYNRHIGLGMSSDDAQAGATGVFEEYRYDALGRRVLVRSRRGPNCQPSALGVECRSYFQHTIWDGDQLLIESRGDGADSLTSEQLQAGPYSGGSGAYGRVVYTHAGGIDQPLSVIKNAVAIMPHTNWRGQYDIGTLASGAPTTTCSQFNECSGVFWPGSHTTLDGEVRDPGANRTWWGSIITGKTDGSGLQYMRNRYYDPKTGRFTQQDPIGLAGGLNLYGFAGGDPVNFSDPFGLRECKDAKTGAPLPREKCYPDDPFLERPAVDPLELLVDVASAGAMRSARVAKVAASAAVEGGAGWLGRRALRRGLVQISGGAVEGAHAHHVFPHALRDRFKQFGIDVNRGEYGAWWEASDHLSKAAEYQRRWEMFLATNPSRSDVLEFGQNLARSYGLRTHF